VNRLDRMRAALETEPRAEDLVDDDRAIRLGEALDQDVELVAVVDVPAHVHPVLEDVRSEYARLWRAAGGRSSLAVLSMEAKRLL
jgi:hypothetical protein